MKYNRDEILFQIRKIFKERFKLAPERVTEEAKLKDDLDLDSIDMFDLLTLVEKETNKTLELTDFREVRSVGELADCLVKGLETAPTTPPPAPKTPPAAPKA